MLLAPPRPPFPRVLERTSLSEGTCWYIDSMPTTSCESKVSALRVHVESDARKSSAFWLTWCDRILAERKSHAVGSAFIMYHKSSIILHMWVPCRESALSQTLLYVENP